MKEGKKKLLRPPLCPACKNIRLREMAAEDAEDGRIVAGYLICDQCGGEFAEESLRQSVKE